MEILSAEDLAAHLASGRWPEHWSERYVIARHPYASRETLRVLAEDGNRFVWAAARAALHQKERDR